MPTATHTDAVIFDGQEYAVATPESVRHALEHGRALVTVRSFKTGKHVTILFTGRKAKPGGGYVSRATSEGRVGLGTGADVIEVRDTLADYPDNYVGRLYTDSAEWRAGKAANGARVYAAEKVLAYALGQAALASDIFLATQCGRCGKQLTDPVSVERGLGPECFGVATGSKVAH